MDVSAAADPDRILDGGAVIRPSANLRLGPKGESRTAHSCSPADLQSVGLFETLGTSAAQPLSP
jgi:hypothetical protein